MAMLAAPRRKQNVINLRAKNNAWSNDPTRYGLRILQHMGWNYGKGLGARENGIVEHVVARYKNDDTGLGFEDRNDQWTKHEDDFNLLLANLSNGDNNDEKLHSGVSLEDKSKKSKKRVHYHKFTRGKDLTRYSDKELANIFGKKSLKDNPKPEDKEEAPENTVITNTEKVFTEKGSMEDYFKSKMAAIKAKTLLNKTNNDLRYGDSVDYSFKGFSEEANDEEEEESHLGLGFQSFNNTEENEENITQEIFDNMEDEPEKANHFEECVEEVVTNPKKVFKSKWAAYKAQTLLNTTNNDLRYDDSVGHSFKGFSAETNDEEEQKRHLGFGFQSNYNTEEISVENKKKRKKNKEQKLSNEENITQEIVDNTEDIDTQTDEPEKAKKSKKKKQKHFEECVEVVTNYNMEEISIETKKKSKKNKKQKLSNEEKITQEIVDNTEDIDTQIDEPEKTKKSKKNKQKDFEQCVEEVESRKSKKKKKDVNIVEDHAVEHYIPKKMKKNKIKDFNE